MKGSLHSIIILASRFLGKIPAPLSKKTNADKQSTSVPLPVARFPLHSCERWKIGVKDLPQGHANLENNRGKGRTLNHWIVCQCRTVESTTNIEIWNGFLTNKRGLTTIDSFRQLDAKEDKTKLKTAFVWFQHILVYRAAYVNFGLKSTRIWNRFITNKRGLTMFDSVKNNKSKTKTAVVWFKHVSVYPVGLELTKHWYRFITNKSSLAVLYSDR